MVIVGVSEERRERRGVRARVIEEFRVSWHRSVECGCVWSARG